MRFAARSRLPFPLLILLKKSLPLFRRSLHLPRQLDMDAGRLSVFAEDGVDDFADLMERLPDQRVGQVRRIVQEILLAGHALMRLEVSGFPQHAPLPFGRRQGQAFFHVRQQLDERLTAVAGVAFPLVGVDDLFSGLASQAPCGRRQPQFLRVGEVVVEQDAHDIRPLVFRPVPPALAEEILLRQQAVGRHSQQLVALAALQVEPLRVDQP